jgi:class 3 adenylate cyclase
MANLDQIKYFNERFGKNSPLTQKKLLFSINESLDPDNLKKAISNAITDLGSGFNLYLEKGMSVDATLLFIDISNFSTTQASLNGDAISDFFDEYYDIVIPIIYEYGGEIDKIMGDGIICLFAPPFLTILPEERRKNANKCAEEIVKKTKDTKFASKVAIHSGAIKYFKNKSGYYKEYTIVGKPLTELFRLESISYEGSINFFANSPIHELHKPEIEKNNRISMMYTKLYGPYERHNVIGLKGISYSAYYSKKI